jgi:hypothetical protein
MQVHQKHCVGSEVHQECRIGVLGDRNDRCHNYLLPLYVQVFLVNLQTENHNQMDLQVPDFLEEILEMVRVEAHHSNILVHK